MQIKKIETPPFLNRIPEIMTRLGLLSLLLCLTLYSFAKTTVDGPHVFYEGDQIIVKHFMVSENLCEVKETSFAADDYISLFCKIDPAGKIGFKFPLRTENEIYPSTYEQPEKMFVISDIEGNFSAFATTLKSNGVIDDNFKWTYGNGHLVLVGDFFDRGEHVTACLWLIYKLEAEAKKAGGHVHFILGNHEEMNMRGDDRFAVSKYKRVAQKLGLSVRDLYEKNTVLGRWLRSKNIVEKVGNILFTHGGLSPAFVEAKLSLEKTNEIAQKFMGESPKLIELQSTNGVAPKVFAKNGPLWYRGYFREKVDAESLQKILDAYQAKHIIVGHTVVEKIEPLFEGRLIPVDVKHAKKMSSDGFNSLLIQGNSFFRTSPKGRKEEMTLSILIPSGKDVADDSTPEDNPDNVAATASSPAPASPKIPPVLKAINDGDIIIIKGYLYDHGIDEPFEDKKFTLLHFAIGRGNLEVVRFLIEEDANPYVLYNDKNALMYAIQKEQIPIIQYFIEKDIVDVNFLNKRKQNSLHVAAKQGNLAIVQLLVESGAKIDLPDFKGNTPLQLAEQSKHTSISNYLKTL